VKLQLVKHRDNNDHGISAKEESHSILDVDPEGLYTKVLSKKEQQQKPITHRSQSEYNFLQHKKVNADDISNVLPACSPQLYSILDSPHRTVSSPIIGQMTKHSSIDFTAQHKQLYSSSDSLCAVSSDDDDDDDDDEKKYRSHHKQKSFQPITYLPPKSSSEKRHGPVKKRVSRHRHSDSGMAARSHSASSDHLRKNEFLVQGTTLDGNVTLYAASPVGSLLPSDQAGPILSRLSSQPLPSQDYMSTSRVKQTTMTNTQSLSPHHPSLEQQPVITNMQQQWIAPTVTNVNQPTASLTTSAELSDHQQHQGQKLNNSLPVTISPDQHQGQNTTSSLPASSSYQHQSQNSNNSQSLTANNTGRDVHQDQHTSNSLYQDMLELMQKRETELTHQVSTITANKERLQAENTLLQQENDSGRKLKIIYV